MDCAATPSMQPSDLRHLQVPEEDWSEIPAACPASSVPRATVRQKLTGMWALFHLFRYTVKCSCVDIDSGHNHYPGEQKLKTLLFEKSSFNMEALNHFVEATHATPVNKHLLERVERLTGYKPHRYLRRGIVFSHRDFEIILDKFERGETIFLKTGRGPSSESLHIGHTLPFEFTR